MAYLPLSTANLPDPAIDPAQGSSPEDYFNTVLWTGNGTSQTITGVGFQPDLVWGKGKSYAVNHALIDAVRGSNKFLESSTSDAEDTLSTIITSFDTDGFSVGSAGRLNTSGQTYVAWNWKANGSGVSNTDGSITSTVSANTTSGFSIVSYTGTGVGTIATIGHGLDQAPDWIVVKSRDTSGRGWIVYHSSLGATKKLDLEDTDPAQTVTANWNDTEPTSTVFTVGTGGDTNTTDDFIAYCFHSVDGFSRMGKYVGNGSADGPFVYTGFRPAFVMIKRTDSAGSWTMLDATRDTYNEMDTILVAEATSTETDFGTANRNMDFLSNGFKIRYTTAGGTTEMNASGGTYIYMAFAENPFKYSNAR